MWGVLLWSLVGLWIATRCAMVLRLPVADCDETYNFVEPLHFLLYGVGMQTWEYSQQYALRSYAFLWLYAGPATAVQWITRAVAAAGHTSVGGISLLADEGLIVYFGYRLVTAVASVFCELVLVKSIPMLFEHSRRSPSTAAKMQCFAVLLLALSTAVGHASFSTLPTSFCMSLLFAALGLWIRLRSFEKCDVCMRRRGAIIGSVVIVVLVGVAGWPFALLLAVPMAINFALKAFRWSLVGAVIAAVLCSVLFVVDGWYFCKPLVCAACNIVGYNVFGAEGRGAELYGVEAWDYFFRNLLLQWSTLFIMGVVVFPCTVLWGLWTVARSEWSPRLKTKGLPAGESVVLAKDVLQVAKYSSGFFIWFVFWMRIPHKEERFMVPAYPFLFVASFSALVSLWPRSGNSWPSTLRRVVVVLTVVCFGICSLGRSAAMEHYYGQPQRMWVDSNVRGFIRAGVHHASATPLAVVCVGKEWYRFPTHFFIPRSEHDGTLQATYRFLQTTSFRGALPKPFVPQEGSCLARADMNDLNRPNTGQYVDLTECSMVWDTLDASRQPTLEQDGWLASAVREPSIQLAPFQLLDPTATPLLCRALYFPFLPYYQRCQRWHSLTVRERR